MQRSRKKALSDSTWQRVIRRRKFLYGVGLAASTVGASTLFADNATLTRSDVALLRFAAAVELIEADLWQQYNELGGAVDRHDQPNPGNPSYIAALENLDGDMPQYVSDNTDDEISHAEFLDAYLMSKGEEPVELKPFRTLPSSKATGASQNADVLRTFKRSPSTQAGTFGTEVRRTPIWEPNSRSC